MKQHGFTLLELLVTLAIVGILTAIAWPGYGAVLRRAQRDEARLALLGIQYAEELRYQNLLAYTDRLADARASGGLGLAEHSGAGSYRACRGVAGRRPALPGQRAAGGTGPAVQRPRLRAAQHR